MTRISGQSSVIQFGNAALSAAKNKIYQISANVLKIAPLAVALYALSLIPVTGAAPVGVYDLNKEVSGECTHACAISCSMDSSVSFFASGNLFLGCVYDCLKALYQK